MRYTVTLPDEMAKRLTSHAILESIKQGKTISETLLIREAVVKEYKLDEVDIKVSMGLDGSVVVS